jgi:hypothetical protein
MITNKYDFDGMTIWDQEAVLTAVNAEKKRVRPDTKLIAACERWLHGFVMFYNRKGDTNVN